MDRHDRVVDARERTRVSLGPEFREWCKRNHFPDDSPQILNPETLETQTHVIRNRTPLFKLEGSQSQLRTVLSDLSQNGLCIL